MKSFLHTLLCLFLFALIPGCSSPIPVKALLAASDRERTPPSRVQLSMQRAASDFGPMLRSLNEFPRPCLAILDLMPNNSGAKDLLNDLSPTVEEVLQSVGSACFVTRRMYRSPVNLQSTAAYAEPIPLAKWDGLSFIIHGEITGQEDLFDGRREKRASLMHGFESGDLEADAVRGDQKLMKFIRVKLSVTDSDDFSFIGVPSASYEVRFSQDTQLSSVSLFFSGSGAGASREYQVNQSLADAVASATTACTIHLLGNLFSVPYYKTAPEVFGSDPTPAELRRSKLAVLPRAKLIDWVNNLVAAETTGHKPAKGDFSAASAAVRKAGFNPESDSDLVKFYMARWHSLDYQRAGAMALRRQEANDKERNVAAEQEQAKAALNQDQESAYASLPARLNWPAGTPFVVLDFHRIEDKLTRNAIMWEVSRLNGDDKPRPKNHASEPHLLCMAYSQGPGVLLRALRKLDLKCDYIWMDSQSTLLRVIPTGDSKSTAAPTSVAAGGTRV